jgi:hypothetical protein
MLKVNNPSIYREKDRTKKRNNQKRNQQKRKRNEDVKENQIDVLRKTQKTKLDVFILQGFIDSRKYGKKCPSCHKLYVKSEELTFEIALKDNETPCGYQRFIGRNRINWNSYCLTCQTTIQKKSYIEGTRSFDTHQIITLKRHLAMTTDEMRVALNHFREQFGEKCAACGIQTIRGGKSGFRQESLTDMYPKKRTRADPSCGIEDLRLVCLACQYFQNNSNWINEFDNSLCEIQVAPYKPKNLSPLNDTELSYLLNTKSNRNGKTIELKLKLFARDGRHCRYTGVEMRFESGYWNSVSFDRFNSKEIYTFENTQLVCQSINYVKNGSITEDELNDWITHVRSPNFVFST